MTVYSTQPTPSLQDIHHIGMLISHADEDTRRQGIELAACWGGVRFEAEMVLRHGAQLTWGRDCRAMVGDLKRLVNEGGHSTALVDAMVAAGGLAIIQYHHASALKTIPGGLKPGFRSHEDHLRRALRLAKEEGHPYTAACLRFWLTAFTTRGYSTARALASLLCGTETEITRRAA